MKKILFSIAFVLTMGLAASAQFDGFFKWEDVDNRVLDESVFMLPSIHGSLTNTEAPLDGGLLILGVFGAGYAVMRKKK
jgi:hypothetical protein